jgi:signal transduction histidine kinase
MIYNKNVFVIVFLIASNVLFAFQDNTSEKFQDSIRLEVVKLSDSLRAQKFYNAALFALRSLNDLKLTRVYADSAMYYAKVSSFKDSEAKSHFQFGLIERIEGNYEKALDHLDRNIRYFKNDSTLIAYSLFQVGVIHRRQGDYENSLKTYTTILNIFQKKKDSFAMASTLNSIGNIYGEMKSPDEGIKNFDLALKIFKAKNSKRDVANAYENIGKMYLQKNDSEAAISSLTKALTISRAINEDYQIAKALNSLGTAYQYSNPDKALGYLLESKFLFENKNFERELILVYNNIASCYNTKIQHNRALEYFNRSLQLAQKLQEKPYVKDAYKGLSETHRKLGNMLDAFNFQTNYIQLKDSLLNSENLKTVNILQKQFETKKKNAEINEQKLRLKEQENLLQEKQIQTNYAIGISGLFLILSIASWLVYKQRQKRKDQELLVVKNEAQINALESLIEGEEKERFRIAKELHDGVNGDLSAIKHKLNTLLKLNNKTIEETVLMIDKSCEQVRTISHNLVPPALENFDLQTAASDYCTNMNNIHTPTISFNYIGEMVILPKIVEVNVFRIIQELVTNSIKHAEASEINVQLSCRENALQLAVDDDGNGFDNTQPKSEGVGISNIKNRVSFLNGEIDFSSTSKGTSVNIFMDKTKFNND